MCLTGVVMLAGDDGSGGQDESRKYCEIRRYGECAVLLDMVSVESLERY